MTVFRNNRPQGNCLNLFGHFLCIGHWEELRPWCKCIVLPEEKKNVLFGKANKKFWKLCTISCICRTFFLLSYFIRNILIWVLCAKTWKGNDTQLSWLAADSNQKKIHLWLGSLNLVCYIIVFNPDYICWLSSKLNYKTFEGKDYGSV